MNIGGFASLLSPSCPKTQTNSRPAWAATSRCRWLNSLEGRSGQPDGHHMVVAPTTSSRQVASERPLRTRPVQKHKRTRDLRPVPIRIRGGGCYVSTIWKPHEYFDLTDGDARPAGRRRVIRWARTGAAGGVPVC